MKTIQKVLILLCPIVVLSSCEEPVENMKYTRDYTYNYFVINELDSDVVLVYSDNIYNVNIYVYVHIWVTIYTFFISAERT